MTTTASRRRRTGAAAATLPILFVVGLAMRPEVVGLGPLLPRMTAELDVQHAGAGLLTAIPILCMGLLAPFAPAVVRRVGTTASMTACLTIVAVFGTWRAAAGTATAVFVTTVALGIGLGLAQGLLPIVVKERAPLRPAVATGLYVAGIKLGAAGSSWVAVPIADSFGGWRASLAVFSVLVAVIAAVWVVAHRGGWVAPAAAEVRQVAAPAVRAFRRPIVWVVVLLFSLQSMAYYGLNTWLPSYHVETGTSEAFAGVLLAVFNLAGLLASLVVPRWADASGQRRRLLVGAGATMTAGVVGVLLAPGAALVWVAVCGAATASVFTLGLTLPLDLGADRDEAGAVSSLVLGVGYTVAGVSPWLLGAFRDATGSFGASLWFIAALSAGAMLTALPLRRERLVPPERAPA